MLSHRISEFLLQPPAMLQKDFVRELSPQALEELDRIRTRYSVSNGELLFSRGEQASRLFEILSGAVKLWFEEPGREVLMVRLAKAGELLGLREVVTGGSYFINATAATDVELATVPRSSLLELIQNRFDIGFSATRLLSSELNAAHEKLRSIVSVPSGHVDHPRRRVHA